MLRQSALLLAATLVAAALPSMGQSILGSPLVPNDEAGGAIEVPGDSSTIVGANLGATMGAPDDYCTPDEGATVWYKYKVPASGAFVVDTIGSRIDTVLRISYWFPDIPVGDSICNDDRYGATDGSSAIYMGFNTVDYDQAGRDVYVTVGGAHGEQGVFQINFNAVAGPLPVGPLPCFEYNPSALTNACLAQGSIPVTAPAPSVTLTNTPLCVIGTQCVNVPTPVISPGSQQVGVPAPTGYVELTFACGILGTACRVTV
jgi:hypothetical protein